MNEKKMRKLMGIKEEEQKQEPQAWYFYSKIEKMIIIISFLALVYTIIRIVFTGFW